MKLFGGFGGGKATTFKPVKNHKTGSKREAMHEYTKKTLGSGNMVAVVRLPDGEELNEWLAANTVDFFNEISLIWGIVCEMDIPPMSPGEGFPHGFEYRWADGVKIKSAIRCSATEYIEYVMTWIEDQINNEAIFPQSVETPFPRNYSQVIKQVYTKMFRIFAIIYSHHFSKLEEVGAVAHLNTSFKHFLFFSWEFELIEARELDAIREIVAELRRKYDASA